MGSVMNSLAGESDSSRFTWQVVDSTGGTGTRPRWIINYQLNLVLGTRQTFQGQATLTFRPDDTGKWQILLWEDARKAANPAPPSWGRLRFQNRG